MNRIITYDYHFFVAKKRLFLFDRIAPSLLVPEKGTHWLLGGVGVSLLARLLLGLGLNLVFGGLAYRI